MAKKSFKTGFDSLIGEGADARISQTASVHTPLPKTIETRATFIVDATQLEQIKAISYWERKKIKAILKEALDTYITAYKSKKGEIILPSTD